jgi:hypothetical protein
MKKVNQAEFSKNSHTAWYETSAYETLGIAFAACILSALILIVCSSHSFLVAADTSFSLNTDFIVGKSLMKGVLPYESLYASQGFLLYCLYGLASLVSSNSFLGVLILEILAGGAFMTLLYKIARLYVEKIYAVACMLAPVILMCVSSLFQSLDVQVWLGLPWLAYSLYAMILQLQKQKISGGRMLSIGLAAGVVLQLAPSLFSFFVLCPLFVLVYELIKKRPASGLISLVWFLVGLALPVLAVCFFYMYNTSLHTLIQQYYVLLFENFKAVDYGTVFANLIASLKEFYVSSLLSFGSSLSVLSLFSILGLAAIVYMRKVSAEIYALLSLCTLAIACAFYGQNSLSAYLPLGLYSVFGFVFVAWLLNLASDKLEKLEGLLGSFAIILVVALGGGLYYVQGNWKPILNRTQDPAAELAKWIDESEERSILIYDGQDFGLFRTSDTLPSVYYFVDAPEGAINASAILSMQQQYIQNQQVQFVVYYYETESEPNNEVLQEGYTKLKSLEAQMQGEAYTIELYSKKDMSQQEETQPDAQEEQESENE